MFTGLIEEMGTVRSIRKESGGVRLEISACVVIEKAQIGDSIAVNGVCLTVTALGSGTFCADVMNETVSHSTLADLRTGDAVNLEKSLTLQTPLGGHLVLGDVEAVGTILSVKEDGFARRVTVSVPEQLSRYIVKKGRITVDGASLTVTDEEPGRFSVSLIPHTLEAVRLGRQKPGDRVNIETDILAKYTEKLLAHSDGTGHGRRSESERQAGSVSKDLLKENGFWS
ncbi:MAG: riboflavin synthase [Spirochaetia bacterium]|nr:riboflavin synthase [Spirochaetia bacterium]